MMICQSMNRSVLDLDIHKVAGLSGTYCLKVKQLLNNTQDDVSRSCGILMNLCEYIPLRQKILFACARARQPTMLHSGPYCWSTTSCMYVCVAVPKMQNIHKWGNSRLSHRYHTTISFDTTNDCFKVRESACTRQHCRGLAYPW